ncbi:hypothetical protein ACFX2G_034889 [Malus domestica]
MESSSPSDHVSGGRCQTQTVSKNCDTIFPAMKKYQYSSQRTPSFSSSSSWSSSSSFVSSSCNLDHDSSPPINPATLLPFSGVPFSWEHFPGIPKKPSSSSSNNKELQFHSSLKRLPQPPPTHSNQKISSKKLIMDDIIQIRHNSKRHTANLPKDPFFAALVECSKDNDGNNNDDDQGYSSGAAKVSRSVSERFGFFNLSALSCKTTCAVSESIIHVQKPSTTYHLINRRSR